MSLEPLVPPAKLRFANKPREELNPKMCPFPLEAMVKDRKLALIFLKVAFEECQAGLKIQFTVLESHRFL